MINAFEIEKELFDLGYEVEIHHRKSHGKYVVYFGDGEGLSENLDEAIIMAAEDLRNRIPENTK